MYNPAYQVNPFVKFRGLELFGVIEQARGANTAAEAGTRTWNQYAAEAVYRFLDGERLFISSRYNTAEGELVGISQKLGADRAQFGAGWFLTPNMLLKGEWVSQKYHDFPTTDIRSGGRFKGFMTEGVVAI